MADNSPLNSSDTHGVAPPIGSYRDAVPILYRRLKELAAGSLRKERRNHTLQPTALANEAFLRIARQRSEVWNDPPRFAALASRIMRRILVDYARGRGRLKRGGSAQRLALDDTLVIDFSGSELIVEVSDALRKLTRIAPRAARVVELRFFSGFSNEECATLLAVNVRSIERDWRYAKAWLYRELGDLNRGEAADPHAE